MNIKKTFMSESKEIIRQKWKEFVQAQYINSPKIRTITLVGSRAKGTARLSSDADFKILIDRLPERLHVNPRTGERTKLLTGRDEATIDFSHFMKNIKVSNIALDPFIVSHKNEYDYVGPRREH
jgi:predicted nucleotidyltransferase